MKSLKKMCLCCALALVVVAATIAPVNADTPVVETTSDDTSSVTAPDDATNSTIETDDPNTPPEAASEPAADSDQTVAATAETTAETPTAVLPNTGPGWNVVVVGITAVILGTIFQHARYLRRARPVSD